MKRKYGTGTVTPCRSGFRARMRDEHGRRVSLGIHPTRERAEAELRAAVEQLQSTQPIRGCVSLEDFAAIFFRKREASEVRSVKKDRSRWSTHISPWECAKWPLEAITPVHVRSFRDELLRKPAKPGHRNSTLNARKLSRQTVQNVLNLLRVALECAVESGAIPTNPARGVRLPESAGLRTREPWTYLLPQEQIALLAACPIPERYAVQFAIGSGLRQGEQWCLELEDVRVRDTPHPHVIVRYGSPGLPPKNGRIRVVPLGRMAVEALEHQLDWLAKKQKTNPKGLAFPSIRGHRRAITKAPKHWKEWLEASGIKGATGAKIVWHSLRHSAASMLVSGFWGRRFSLEEVKEFLGHVDIQSTHRYAHLAPGALFQAFAQTSDWRPTETAALPIGTLVTQKARQVSGSKR